jgi:1,4-alpha-glucan branching enzyme
MTKGKDGRAAPAPAGQGAAPGDEPPAATPGAPAEPSADAPPQAEDFPPTLGDVDLHLLGEGRHLRLHDVMGGHLRTLDGVAGASFSVWAPAARKVCVTGDFNGWDQDDLPLRPLGDTGVHERFVPGASAGQHYKFVVHTRDEKILLKTDPYARSMEQPPGNAARLTTPPAHDWGDGAWLARRAQADPHRAPISIYELHLGSWLRGEDGPLTFREAMDTLVGRVKELGFTHVELLPVMEHPFGGSWGYQVTGYFAATSRWGTPDELRALIDAFHQADIGVILDWVPAHFPRDEHALYRFDGTALYEHLDPRKGHHPDWDTAIFNYGRPQVSNFLLASALHWLNDYHADGLRVDAVASMLYLDYSREEGQWEPNAEGGRENLEAVTFLRALTDTVREQAPGALLIAEESTTWPGVTKPTSEDGLGFHFKWNMGWMHDTLDYFGTDPLWRGGVHEKLTFSMMYEYSEHYMNALSHDEVVHGKGSLAGKMPGEEADRFANLRCLLAYQFTRPGKPMLFMGTELGSFKEWDHDGGLDWDLLEEPARAGVQAFVQALAALYRERQPLWRGDPDESGFTWIEADDKDRSLFAYLRTWEAEHLLVVLNLTPVPREAVVLGVPEATTYEVLLDSDAAAFGGTGHGAQQRTVSAAEGEIHGQPARVELELPPLSALVLAPAGAAPATSD